MNSWITALGYFGVILFPFVESMGIPIPTAFAFIAAVAILESEGATVNTYVIVFGLLVLGQMGGSLIGYFLGSRSSGWVERRLTASARFSKTYETVQRFYGKWGVLTVIIARLCGYIRPWTSLASGLMRMRLLPFVMATFIGSTIWTGMTFYLIRVGYRMYEAGGTRRIIVFLVLALVIMMILGFWLRARKQTGYSRR